MTIPAQRPRQPSPPDPFKGLHGARNRQDHFVQVSFDNRFQVLSTLSVVDVTLCSQFPDDLGGVTRGYRRILGEKGL
jgi:hypothetical protein